ncbi:Anthranilate N-hydroxycinnamoyl/benzoyltransferase-like protein [Citrus sinensis]|uniref:Anthranilate N-hydroxycinnamoyl/benzoyltransferase-like protein n=1 Tax=Citrus sinensis TaxID=2711 RepID=A0ACB8JSS6_CITSI|nr:Anthranilate N-hydroxycinnamoyl/benzoyltransferase-like protein [Citrus sinensis]
MGRTQIISKSTVCAAIHKEPDLRIDLTPWDLKLIQFDTIQKGLLFRKPSEDNTDTSSLNLIHHLKTSLSRTLDYFPPLAGRLATIEHRDDSNTISVYINCNNAGAEFVHAMADGVSVADIITPVYVPNETVYSFFPLNGVTNCQCISEAKPLLGVQVTELVDGIFIACTINHSVVDGTSFWHFFNSWSEISRGSDCISKLPVLERGFLSESEYFPIRLPLWSIEPSGTHTPPPNLRQRVFHFTKENIAKLKAKANAEIGSTNKISSLQAILSQIWRSFTRNRSLDPDEEVLFVLGIGVRQRLQPPLPPEYFGNAAQGEFVSMKARYQLEQGLGNVALKMNKFIAASPRFNFYGNDFGWGRPMAVRSGPANKVDGKITLFAGVEEGSVDVEACFLPETLQVRQGSMAIRSGPGNKADGKITLFTGVEEGNVDIEACFLPETQPDATRRRQRAAGSRRSVVKLIAIRNGADCRQQARARQMESGDNLWLIGWSLASWRTMNGHYVG